VTGCLCSPPEPTSELPALPTPCARDGKGAAYNHGQPDVVQRSGLLPTPTAVAYGSNQTHSPEAVLGPSLGRLIGSLLPTPTVADSRSSANATAHRSTLLSGHARTTLTDAARLLPTLRGSDGAKGCPGQRGSHGAPTLPSAAVRVLPTPTRSDGRGGAGGHRGGGPNLRTAVAILPTADEARWGDYAAAVGRWEVLLDRPVPAPTQPGTHGKPVLAPLFVEWLMGLSPGWVTGLDLPRTLALRILGNGVVPQQAAVALRLLLCPHRWEVP
jgi:hypothetical protein